MIPSIKTLWVEALRSGRYKQGINHMRNKHNQFCCLGVLCDVWSTTLGGVWSEELYGSDKYYYGFIFDDQIGWSGPPSNIQTHTELDSKFAGDNLNRSICWKLITMNDSENKSFPEIADWIEENL